MGYGGGCHAPVDTGKRKASRNKTRRDKGRAAKAQKGFKAGLKPVGRDAKKTRIRERRARNAAIPVELPPLSIYVIEKSAGGDDDEDNAEEAAAAGMAVDK
jgi:hypothetical protein